MDLSKLQAIPAKKRAIGFIVLLVILTVLFVWQIVMPKRAEIEALQTQLTTLQARIRENDEKIRKLDELKTEVAALKEKLKLLTDQLPPDVEVSGLLRQVQGLVSQAGLTLKLWKLDKRKTHASGLYEEIPITLDIIGGFHNVGVFFDKVGKLTRIVNIQNLKMTGAKLNKSGTVDIAISFAAVTFAAVEKKADAQEPAGKKNAPAKKAR